MVLQHGFASGVNDPGGRPDLGISIGVDIVHEEIDQAPLFLEHRQELDDFGLCAGFLGAELLNGGRRDDETIVNETIINTNDGGGHSQGDDPFAGAGAGADAAAPTGVGSGAGWNDSSPPAEGGSGWDDSSPATGSGNSGGGNDDGPPDSGGGNEGGF